MAKAVGSRGRNGNGSGNGNDNGLGNGNGLPDPRPALRREGDATVPAGPKARRTRARLLASATELFASQGYGSTSVAAIAERAGVSLGTFYQYFRDRNDVLVAMLTANLQEMFEGSDSRWRAAEGKEGLRRIVGNFVGAYVTTAETVAVWEEVSHVDPDMADLRRALGRGMTDALEHELVRAGKKGLCRLFTTSEAAIVARALAAMVDRFCYVAFVFDPPPEPIDPAEATNTLTDLWARSIDLRNGD